MLVDIGRNGNWIPFGKILYEDEQEMPDSGAVNDFE
jgi:hypothetical protein